MHLNYPPWPMAGENFEIYLSQMVKNTLKISTMVGENSGSPKFAGLKMAKNATKLSWVSNKQHSSPLKSEVPSYKVAPP
jgi:hypothetical protein